MRFVVRSSKPRFIFRFLFFRRTGAYSIISITSISIRIHASPTHVHRNFIRLILRIIFYYCNLYIYYKGFTLVRVVRFIYSLVFDIYVKMDQKRHISEAKARKRAIDK